MENSFMQPWSYQQEGPTSPVWKPCWAPSLIVLSSLIPHHTIHQTTFNGGSGGSVAQMSHIPYSNPKPPQTTRPTLMPVLESGLQSQLAPGGEHGSWSHSGNPRAETSNGWKPLALSCSSSAYAPFQARANTWSSTAATGELWKGGGKSPVPTNPPTTSSDMSSTLQKLAIGLYTQNTSQALRTPLMPPQGVFIPPATSSLSTSTSLPKYSNSLLTYDLGDLLRGAVIKKLAHSWDTADGPALTSPVDTKHQKPLKVRPHHIPLPPLSKKPAPYLTNLTPLPSDLCPHCLARDRLQRWTPASKPSSAPSDSMLDEAEQEHIKDTMVHAWDKVLRYCRNVCLTWVKFNSKDTKESEWCSRF